MLFSKLSHVVDSLLSYSPKEQGYFSYKSERLLARRPVFDYRQKRHYSISRDNQKGPKFHSLF